MAGVLLAAHADDAGVAFARRHSQLSRALSTGSQTVMADWRSGPLPQTEWRPSSLHWIKSKTLIDPGGPP